MFDSTKRLQSGGVLDDFEVRVLHDQINLLVKNLATIPILMKPVPAENLFLNITWVNGDRDLGEFLIQNSIICDFDLGDLIVQDDEEPDSIFLIIRGLVKIVHGNLYAENDSAMMLEQSDRIKGSKILKSLPTNDFKDLKPLYPLLIVE